MTSISQLIERCQFFCFCISAIVTGGVSQRNCVAINQRRAGPDKAITDFFIIVFIKTLLITLQDGKYLWSIWHYPNPFKLRWKSSPVEELIFNYGTTKILYGYFKPRNPSTSKKHGNRQADGGGQVSHTGNSDREYSEWVERMGVPIRKTLLWWFLTP